MAGDLRGQIFRLEGEIEALSVSVERSRKIAVAAKVAIGGGCILLGSILVGAIGADGLSLLVATILGIGGVVVLGSNETTMKETTGRIEEAERLRAELINAIDLQLVPQQQQHLLH